MIWRACLTRSWSAGLGCDRMADLVPVPIARILESLRMRRVVFEDARIQVDDLVAERRRLAAKCLPHEVREYGPAVVPRSRPRSGIR